MHCCAEGTQLDDHEWHGGGGDDDGAWVREGEACGGAGEACVAAGGAVEVWVVGAGGGEADEVADAAGLEGAGGLEVVELEEDSAASHLREGAGLDTWRLDPEFLVRRGGWRCD